jgi:pimeloyl-ACP methyl ester carboxylesterase
MDRRMLLSLGVTAATIAATPGVASAAPATPSDATLARSLPGDFRSAYLQVNGTRLHYVTGGAGAPLILLPGWPQTWWQFHKVMPTLAERYRVIAVDLRGMGGSSKPPNGYDKKTMARDIRELALRLGYDKVNVAGHDIGAMVAYSLAANYPDAVRRLSLLDVTHPDESLYQLTLLPTPGQPFFLWWFAFNQVQRLPEQLLTGRSRLLIDWLFDHILLDPNAIPEHDRAIYAHAYSPPDAIRAGNAWYQTFSQDIIDEKTYPKLTMPILALAAAGNYDYLNSLLPGKATDVRIDKIENAGHYLPEEQPNAIISRLTDFFG